MQWTISGILIGLIVAASTGSGDIAAGEAMTPLERLAGYTRYGNSWPGKIRAQQQTGYRPLSLTLRQNRPSR